MDNTLAAQFTVSDTGALVYVTGGVVPETQRSLAWVDRQGTSQALPAPPRAYRTPRLSPDGRHVAVYSQEGIRQVWSYDIARGALSAVTVDGRSSYGIFAPDQKRMAFRSGAAGGEDNLYWKAADGSGPAERLTTSARSQTPASWSPDGTTLAFVEEGDLRVRLRSFSSISGCCRSPIARPVRSSRRLPTKPHPSFPRTAVGWRTSRTNPDAPRSTCSRIPARESVI